MKDTPTWLDTTRDLTAEERGQMSDLAGAQINSAERMPMVGHALERALVEVARLRKELEAKR